MLRIHIYTAMSDVAIEIDRVTAAIEIAGLIAAIEIAGLTAAIDIADVCVCVVCVLYCLTHILGSHMVPL